MASLNDIETKIQNIVDVLEYRSVSTITGTLPMTFRSNGTVLINYRIYGTADGAGVQTENLFDLNAVVNGEFATVNGFVKVSHYSRSDYISVVSGEKYYLANIVGSSIQISGTVYDDNKQPISNISIPSSPSTSGFFTVPSNGKYIIVNYLPNYSDKNTIMVIQTETAPDHYIPYGYKIPLITTSGTESKDTDIFIGDSKLLSGDYVDYESGKIVRNGTPQDPPLLFPELETFNGKNTLDSTETLGEVTIKGKIKEVI